MRFSVNAVQYGNLQEAPVMAKKIFDKQKLKEFLFNKGERLGLVIIGGLSLLVLALTFTGASPRPPAQAGADTWGVAITNAAKNLEQKIETSQPDVKDPAIVVPDWDLRNPKFGPWGDFLEPGIIDVDKRTNPEILPVSTGDGDVQVYYLPAPTLDYDVKFATEKVMAVDAGEKADKTRLVKMLEPRRMIVVQATFPIDKQLEVFSHALRIPKDQLEKSDDAPRFLGLEIMRAEILPDGKEKPMVPLYRFDPKLGRTVVPAFLDVVFKKMVIDTESPKSLANYLGENMVTPIPELATGRYPPIKLNGIDAPEPKEVKKKGPKMKDPQPPPKFPNFKKPPIGPKGEVGKGVKHELIPWKNAGRELRERFKGNYNVFDPYGAPLAKGNDKAKDPKNMFAQNPNKGFPVGVKPKDKEDDPDAEAKPPAEPKLLVRFIDVDVEVGRTYRYYIQVRVVNPNFGKVKEVAHEDLANVFELRSPVAATPMVTVPPEYFFYAMNAKSLQSHGGFGPQNKKFLGNDLEPADQERTPVQIHVWVNRTDVEIDKSVDSRLIGDWVIAERLLVRRGESIGRNPVFVETPEWNTAKGHYILGTYSSNKLKNGKGIPVNFLVDNPAPLLVDFQGGRFINYMITKKNLINDRAGVEVLVLGADGRLSVRNSRVDGDEKSMIGQDRSQRYQYWRDRLEELRGEGDTGPQRVGPVGFPKR
jgi:hypothetical protein